MTMMKSRKSGNGGGEKIRNVGGQKEKRRKPCLTRRIWL
jgi:hypothetical protein